MRKVLTFLIAVMMVVNCMVPAVFAAGHVTVSVSDAEGNTGDTVEITVSLSEATFATYFVKLEYDANALELLSITQDGIQLNADGEENYFLCNLQEGLVADMDIYDHTVSGVLFTAEFKIIATKSGNYPVSVSVDNFTDADWNELTASVNSGNISVKHACQWGEWVITKAATCTDDGSMTRTCSACGATESKGIPAAGHAMGAWKTDKEAACGVEGKEVSSCATCGHKEYRTVSALEHKWSAYEVTQKATCEKAGTETRSCSLCGAKESREIAKLGHNAEWTTTKEASCGVEGVSSKVCQTCGVTTETKEIPALEHKWSAYEVTQKATCEQAGTETRSCSLCGAKESREIAKLAHNAQWTTTKEAACGVTGISSKVCQTCGVTTETKEIPALEHKWSGYEVTQKATCEKAGTEIRVCSQCGAKESREIAKLGHNAEWTTTKAPACGVAGVSSKVCATCGKTTETASIPALEHKWSAYEVTQKATCEKAGTEIRSCSLCGAEESREIPKLGHNAEWTTTKEAACGVAGVSSKVCATCGKTIETASIPALKHDYDSVTVKPTCTEQGYTSHTCSRCEDTYTDKYIAAEGHTIVNGVCTVCGSPEVLLGDANDDGAINNIDAMLILQYAVGLKDQADLVYGACDVSGDGVVNNIDAMLILQYAVGLITSFKTGA